MATYYISPTGSDPAAGGISTPWKTFTRAIGSLAAGDTLTLKDGTYARNTTGLLVISGKNGGSGSPITFIAENERQAFINGDGLTPPIQLSNCSYLNFHGIRVKSLDNSGSSTSGNVILVVNSHHTIWQRMLCYRNNRYKNGAIHALETSCHHNLVEECEYYSWARNGLSVGAGSDNNTFRRCYANSRNDQDIAGGYPSAFAGSGDSGFTIYPGSNNIIENCIAENCSSALDLQADGPTVNNKILGLIALNCDRSGLFARRANLDGMARDTLIENYVGIGIKSVGMYLRGTKNTIFRNSTIIGGTGVEGFAADVPSSGTGDGAQSIALTNVLCVNNSGVGFYIVQHPTWSLNYCNGYGNTGGNFSPPATDSHITNELSIDPVLGGAKIWIPPTSTMKGAGLAGADIGANVIYRYQDGTLTATPLWGPSFPHGVIVAGVNDVAGSSAFDVHLRLGVLPGVSTAPDTTPPTGSITSPLTASTVSGIVTITCTAADNVGVANVQFYLDGSPLGGPVT